MNTLHSGIKVDNLYCYYGNRIVRLLNRRQLEIIFLMQTFYVFSYKTILPSFTANRTSSKLFFIRLATYRAFFLD